MPATLKEIAKYSGVSIATVSLALNNKPVCSRTREKVLKAAEKLQYRPSTLARSLRTQKTNTIGLTLGFPNLELIDSVVRTARARGYHVITMPYAQETLEYDKDQERQAYQELLMRRVDGVLAWPSEYLENYSLVFEDFRRHSIPVVVVDRQLAGVSVPSFAFDNRKGALLAWLHLHNLGRSPIIYLDFEHDYSTLRARRDGIKDGMLARGVRWDDRNYVQVCGRDGIHIDSIRDAIQRACNGGAIFAAADHIAFSVLRIANEIGVRIPEDLAVIGFEDVVIWLKERVGWTTCPPLSTIRMQFDQVGLKATEFLLDYLEKKENEPITPDVNLLEPLLVVRKSCGGKSGIYGFDDKGEITFRDTENKV